MKFCLEEVCLYLWKFLELGLCLVDIVVVIVVKG